MVLAYDNWERLVQATLRRIELREVALEHSRTPSATSTSSNLSSSNDSPLRDLSSKNSSPPVLRQLQASSSQQQNLQEAANIKNAKILKKRTSSKLRLDRWIWNRWLSK